jgi:L-threonylcarbamoyladenylate synthase
VIVTPERAVALLAAGDIVAYPTETVYGLGADALSAAALERLLAAKGRTRERGLSVLVADAAALARWAPGLPPRAARLAARFWPGPLTLVVAALPALGGVATPLGVGFRCSPQPTAAALARGLGRPLVCTSCNRTGALPCGDAAAVARVFGEGVAIAGGEPAGGLPPSTVVAVLADGGLELVREGAIPFETLEKERAA